MLLRQRLEKLLKHLMGSEKFRWVLLKNEMLDSSLLKSMEVDPDFENIVEELEAFTGLSKLQIIDRLRRTPRTHFKSEFHWHAPADSNELAWFYRCSYGYLFANSAHPYWKMLNFLNSQVGRILDYGAGVGNNVIPLAKRGLVIDYMDTSILQESFTRFRVARHGLQNVFFVSPYKNNKFDPLGCVSEIYGAIILQNVLEHIPQYHFLLRHLIDHLRPGGYIIENSSFGKKHADIDLHLRPYIPMEEAMLGMQAIQPCIWKKLERT